MALNHMKQQADQGHFEREFFKGDQVFLCLQLYKKQLLKFQHYQKRPPKFYGPYCILNRVEPLAYPLDFPSHSKPHLVFHVSYLKNVLDTRFHPQTNLPELDEEDSIWLQQ
jgi:hypothetical protein